MPRVLLGETTQRAEAVEERHAMVKMVINKAERKINNIRQTQHELVDENLEIKRAKEEYEQQIMNIKRAARMKIRAKEEEDNKLKLHYEMLKEHVRCILVAQSIIN